MDMQENWLNFGAASGDGDSDVYDNGNHLSDNVSMCYICSNQNGEHFR